MGPSVAYSMKVLPSVKKTQNSSNARWNQDILTGIARIFAIWMETLPAKIDQLLIKNLEKAAGSEQAIWFQKN